MKNAPGPPRRGDRERFCSPICRDRTPHGRKGIRFPVLKQEDRSARPSRLRCGRSPASRLPPTNPLDRGPGKLYGSAYRDSRIISRLSGNQFSEDLAPWSLDRDDILPSFRPAASHRGSQIGTNVSARGKSTERLRANGTVAITYWGSGRFNVLGSRRPGLRAEAARL